MKMAFKALPVNVSNLNVTSVPRSATARIPCRRRQSPRTGITIARQTRHTKDNKYVTLSTTDMPYIKEQLIDQRKKVSRPTNEPHKNTGPVEREIVLIRY